MNVRSSMEINFNQFELKLLCDALTNGVILSSNSSQVEKIDPLSWLWVFDKDYVFKDDVELSKQLHIVADKNIPGKFYLAPNIEMFVTRFLYLFEKFVLLCCKNSFKK